MKCWITNSNAYSMVWVRRGVKEIYKEVKAGFGWNYYVYKCIKLHNENMDETIMYFWYYDSLTILKYRWNYNVVSIILIMTKNTHQDTNPNLIAR